jgi:hypothetical protein
MGREESMADYRARRAREQAEKVREQEENRARMRRRDELQRFNREASEKAAADARARMRRGR